MTRMFLGACVSALLATGCTSALNDPTGIGGALGGGLGGTTPNGGSTTVNGTTTPTTTGTASCSAPNYNDTSSAWTVPASGYGGYGGQHLPPNWSSLGFASEDDVQAAIEGVAAADRPCFKTRWPGAYTIFKRNGGSW